MHQRAVVPARALTKNGRVIDDIDPDVRKRIGGRLKALRNQQHLDQIEVASLAGVSTGTLQTIERGIRKNRGENIAKVAKVFGTTLKALAQQEQIDPTDALLAGLNREDFEIARAYHEATSTVRHQAAQVLLRERDLQGAPPVTGEAEAREARIAGLTTARQQLIDDLINESVRYQLRVCIRLSDGGSRPYLSRA